MNNMMLSTLAILLLCGCDTNSGPPNILNPEVEKALLSAKNIKLVSIDPCCHSDDAEEKTPRLQGYHIIGEIELSDKTVREQVTSAFARDLAGSTPDGVAACFDPRHALRIEADGEIHEFVICFECYKTKWYLDGNYRDLFSHPDRSKSVFNELLTDAGIELAKLPGDE